MGLDLVELVMRVEEDFNIEIGDDEASQISTPGQLHQFLLLKLNVDPSSRCLSSTTFYQLRRCLVAATGKKRREITPKTPMEQLLPKRERRKNWQQLMHSSGIHLPDLVLPQWLSNFINLGFGAFFIAALVAVASQSGLWAWAFFLGGFAYLTVAFKVTTPLARCFPPSCQTVGSTTKVGMISLLGAAPGQPTSVKSEEIWEALRAIIADELSVPLEIVTPNTDFIRDLGAD